jgi:hypothetical protein
MSPSHHRAWSQKAIAAHATWRNRLTAAVATGCSPPADDAVHCAEHCELGMLLRDCAPPSESVTSLRRLHEDLHKAARDVLARVAAGDHRGAEQLLLGDCTLFADRVVQQLVGIASGG